MFMKQYGLIGEKLGHSLSVPIHEAIWEKISLAASYRLIEIPRSELAAVVPELLCTLDGFNITVPYKTDVMPLLDEITPFAREVGAVNTVLTGKTSRGYNTDDPGFEQMLRYFGMNPDGRPVFILGSGGAMRACRNAVERMGARVRIYEQTAVIEGVPQLHGAAVEATDLRAGAALVIAGLMAQGTTEIYNTHFIDRGYEHLEEKLNSLGAKISRTTD